MAAFPLLHENHILYRCSYKHSLIVSKKKKTTIYLQPPSTTKYYLVIWRYISEMSKRQKQTKKNIEVLPSDMWIFEIFRYHEISKVLNVFTLLNKTIRRYALKSIENRQEKDFRILYFSNEEEEDLNISEHDITMMIRRSTFDLRKVGMNIVAFLAEIGYINALKELFSVLYDTKKWDSDREWESGTWIRCVHNEFFDETREEEDLEFQYNIGSDEEDDVEVIEEEHEVDGDENHYLEEEDENVTNKTLTYEIFLSDIDYDNDTNDSIRFYRLLFSQKSIEYKILDLALLHNDLKLVKLASKCYGLFSIPGGERSIEWDHMSRCSTRILKCLERNNDEFACYFVKNYDSYLSFELYLEVLQYAIHSSCQKCSDLLLTSANLHKISSNYDADTTEMTDLYFNAFFCGKRKGNRNTNQSKSTLEKMIDGTLEDDDDGGCRYSDIILDDFMLGEEYKKKGNEFAFSSEEDLDEVMSTRYKIPVHGRKKSADYEESESSDEEEHERNQEYQDEEYFEKELKEDPNLGIWVRTPEEIKRIRNSNLQGFYINPLPRLCMEKALKKINVKDTLKLMRKAGVMSVGGLVWEESKEVLVKFLKDVVFLAVQNCEAREKIMERESGEDEVESEVTEVDIKKAIEMYMKNSSVFVANKFREQMKKKENDMNYLKDVVQ